jgi:hypothetical protein
VVNAKLPHALVPFGGTLPNDDSQDYRQEEHTQQDNNGA